jgi:tRNA1Val (adenine37-N6)-methyltransferase
MKVGTDGVLLGAWADVTNANHILDIGTGSGVIALMLAQRSNALAKIDAVDIEEKDVRQAGENFSNSPWQPKLNAYHSSIQSFKPQNRYDLIVTNPPFFINSFPAPSFKRAAARHTKFLPHDELLQAIARLLTPDGKFCLIIPIFEGEIFQSLAEDFKLYPHKKTAFFSRKEKPQERWLIEFSFEQKPIIENSILLYDHDDTWSKQYQLLTNEFYLNR